MSLPYRVRLWQKSRAEIKTWWPWYRIVAGVLAILIPALWQAVKNHSVNYMALVESIIAFLCLLGLMALVAIVRSPKLVDSDSQQEITRLTNEVAALNPPVSPEEDHRRILVAQILEEASFPPEQKPVLRRIMLLGRMNAATILMEHGFLHRQQPLVVAQARGLLFNDATGTYINPELKSALDFVLRSEGI
jgi:hypothetical protein